MPKPSRAKSKTKRTILALIVLSLALAVTYYTYSVFTSPCVRELPSGLSLQTEGWMSYAPSSAQYVQFINVTEALRFKEGREIIGNKTPLELAGPSFRLRSENVSYLVGMSLTSNQFVNILGTKPEAYAELRKALDRLPGSVAGSYLNRTIHQVRDLDENRRVSTGLLVLDRGHVIYVRGEALALKALNDVLEASSGSGRGLFEDQAHRLVYSLSKQRSSRLAGFSLTISTSPVANENSIGKLVYVSGDTLHSGTYYQYRDQTDALRNLGTAREALFTKARNVCVVGGFISVFEAASLADMNRILLGL